MRAIKIDVVKKDIYEVELGREDYQAMRDLIDAEGYDMVRLSETEALWVDDNGLRRQPPLGAFEIIWYPQALPGHGLIIGLRGPENWDSELTVDEVKGMVKFVDVSELPLPVITIASFDNMDDLLGYIKENR